MYKELRDSDGRPDQEVADEVRKGGEEREREERGGEEREWRTRALLEH